MHDAPSPNTLHSWIHGESRYTQERRERELREEMEAEHMRNVTPEKVANAIFGKQCIATAACNQELEQYYRLANEWYESHTGLDEQG
jgi:hypothetical protein